jgi:hypothetical protein
MDLTQLTISAITFFIIAGGFFFSTKNRLDRIEKDLYAYNKLNTEILDRLARIETKLDFYKKTI